MKIMKRIIIFFSMFMCFGAWAVTTNWYVDNEIYQTTTCASGDNVTPPTPPTKKGFTFQGWSKENTINGTWAQPGIPNSSAPVYPTFYQDGNLILRGLGTGNSRIADTYNPETNTITRRVGVLQLTGNETWYVASQDYAKPDAGDAFANFEGIVNTNCGGCQNTISLSSHFKVFNGAIWSGRNHVDEFTWNGRQLHINIKNSELGVTDYTQETTSSLKTKIVAYIKAQAANGTPITVYYPLANPRQEYYNAQ